MFHSKNVVTKNWQYVQEVVHNEAGILAVQADILETLSVAHPDIVSVGGEDRLSLGLGEVEGQDGRRTGDQQLLAGRWSSPRHFNYLS